MYLERTQNCGVLEYSGLVGNDPFKALDHLEYIYLHSADDSEWGEDGFGDKYVFVQFTDHISCRRGRSLAKLIETNKLGPVLTTARRWNPNSGNFIKVWIWEVNKRKLAKYAITQGWKLNG